MKRNFNFSSKKRVFLGMASSALIAAMALGGTMAYLTDNEQTTNTFTVGKVQIDLEEPHYPGNDDGKVKNIVPNQEIAKDPQVQNTGKNKAVVFASVSIPYKNLVTAEDSGAKKNNGKLTPTQIFKTAYKTGEGVFSDYGDAEVNKGWALLSTEYYDANGIQQADGKNITDPTADTIKVVRTYGYKSTLGTGDTTPAIFDKVKLANVVEGYIDSTTQDIEVKTFAIQAENITNYTTSDNMDEELLGNIYNVYVAQSADVSNKDANTSNKYNLGIGGTVEEVTSYETKISASIDNAKIEVGKTAKITYTVDSLDSKKDQKVTYAVDDDEATDHHVTVSEDGTVKAKSKGKSTITVKTEDGAKATIDVEVKDAASDAAKIS